VLEPGGDCARGHLPGTGVQHGENHPPGAMRERAEHGVEVVEVFDAPRFAGHQAANSASLL
jgi:hypothetical protein